MPSKASTSAVPGASGGTSDVGADPTRELPFVFTNFFAPPPINAKNVASQYLRTESQSWLGRNPFQVGDGPAQLIKDKKRRRLNATRDGTPASDAMEESDDDEDDDDDEGAEGEDGQRRGIPSSSSHTIVIHPGSRHLRIGLATDLAPVTVPQTLARRDKLTAASAAKDGKKSIMEANDEDEEEEEALSAKRSEDLTQGTEALRADLKSIMRNMKLRPVANGRQQTANYNAGVKPEKLAEHQDVFAMDWTESSKVKEDVVLGEKAERLDCFSISNRQATNNNDQLPPWKRFQPFRGGHLNYEEYSQHYGDYAAHGALLKDVITIWSHAIEAPRDLEKESAGQIVEKGLGIPSSDWPYYNVVLVIPDLYLLAEVESLVALLLEDMGFAAVMVQQESVCATFGAGLSSACVIHVGSETTRIACVDEGLVVADSRTNLAYGGDHISEYFVYLLQRANFPFADIRVEGRLADRWLANELKERLCTLDPTQMGLLINDFHVRLPRKPTSKYSLRTYDEVIVGPMCLFNTRAIPLKARKDKLLPLSTTPLITDDEIDDSVNGSVPVTLAMTNCVRHLLPPPAVAPAPGPTAAPVTAEGSKQATPAPTTTGTDAVAPRIAELAGQHDEATTKDDGSAAPSQRASPAPGAAGKQQGAAVNGNAKTGPLNGGGGGGGVNHQALSEVKASSAAIDPAVDIVYEAGKVAIDWAVWNSILASVASVAAVAQSEERMKRMVTNMFCTGGTALLPGMGMAIEARVHNYLSQWFTQQGKDLAAMPNASVVPPPRDMDPRVVTWKGTAVVARLDSTQDLWLGRNEWKMFGMRALREKVIFM